jgi:hypothetical protein
MNINEQTIKSTFERLKEYIETEYEPKVSLFNLDTQVLFKKLDEECNRRYKTRKFLSESFDNKAIIKDIRVWFRKFLIVNQMSSLLYYGTATTKEEKDFFIFCSGFNDFHQISHPTAKRKFDELNFDNGNSGEAASILYNTKPSNKKKDNSSELLDLCCFAIGFFTDDLYIAKNNQNNNMNIIILSSRSLPTLEVPLDKVRIFFLIKFIKNNFLKCLGSLGV